MARRRLLAVGWMLLLGAAPAWPREARTDGGGRRSVVVGLRDGSELVGEIRADSWDVDSAMGRIHVDLDDVASTNLHKTTLRDGSVLVGRVRVESILLRTRFGDFDVRVDKVASVTFPDGSAKERPENDRPPTAVARAPDAQGRGLRGMMGIGMDLNAVELGFGPFLRYWATDHIGAQAGYIALGGVTGYNVRGLYAFDRRFDFAGDAFVPYAGVGYLSVGETADEDGIQTDVKGSGPTFSAGLHGGCFGLSPRLFCTTEIMYAAVKMTATATIPGPPAVSVGVSQNFSAFSVGFSLAYYFSPAELLPKGGSAGPKAAASGGQAWHSGGAW